MKQPERIAPAEGKLGLLLPGLGAVSTTTIAGVMLARRGLAEPVGSVTQCATVRLGRRTDNRSPLVRDFLPLASLDDLVFGGWDIFPEDALLYARLQAQTEEMNRMAAVQSDFLRGVTHDLQTPLTSIRALASELGSNADLSDAARNDLMAIAHQSDRMRRMVGQLLAVSRLEAGALESRQEIFIWLGRRSPPAATSHMTSPTSNPFSVFTTTAPRPASEPLVRPAAKFTSP